MCNEGENSLGVNIQLKCEGLSKYYGQRQVLKELSFALQGPGLVALLGVNGAGKTTLLRTLALIQSFDAGRILVGTELIPGQEKKARKCVTYLGEKPALYPEQTAEEYLWLLARLYGLEDERAKMQIAELLRRLGLYSQRKRLAMNLSYGYKKRLALARALLSPAPILLFDEVTEGLDPNQATETIDLLKHWGQERLMVLSSHRLDELSQLAQRFLLLHEGAIIADYQARDLLSAQAGDLQLEILLRGTWREVKRQLSQASQLSSFKLKQEQGDLLSLLVDFRSVEDKERFLKQAALAPYQILEWRSRQNALERSFRDLTRKAAAEGAAEQDGAAGVSKARLRLWRRKGGR